MAWGHQLSKGEAILSNSTKDSNEDINDVLGLHNIAKYLANGQYLRSWSENDIEAFVEKGKHYTHLARTFFSSFNDSNVKLFYDQLLGNYQKTFWEVVNNQKVFKRINSETLPLS